MEKLQPEVPVEVEPPSFAEFGVSIQQQAPQPADILISLSCDQAASAGGFQWPYAKNGISSDTAKRIVAVVQKTFGG